MKGNINQDGRKIACNCENFFTQISNLHSFNAFVFIKLQILLTLLITMSPIKTYLLELIPYKGLWVVVCLLNGH